MKKNLIVPIVFDLLDSSAEKPALSWVFEMYTNYCVENDMAIIAQENYFKQDIKLLNKTYDSWSPKENEEDPTSFQIKQTNLNKKKNTFLKYAITNNETNEIDKGRKVSFEDQVYFMSHINRTFEKIVNNKLDKIEKDFNHKVDAILTWYWNPSLSNLAIKRNIKLINQEISPIRNINQNFNTSLSYFVFGNKFDSDYCKDLYDQFLDSDSLPSIKIFSREELLAIFLNKEDLGLLKLLQTPPEFDLGISPPIENDFFFEIYKNEPTIRTFKKINKLFPPEKVSIRYRLEPSKKIGNPKWDIDSSNKSLYWVVNCKRILTYVSNIAFDAMMLGKTVYLLSNNMPFSFKSITSLAWKDESVVDSLYLNFMLFGYFVPWDLMLNQDYIDWRLTNPSIIDIYKKNQEYIFKKMGLDKIKNISLREILSSVHKLNEKEIQEIQNYSEFLYIKALKEDIINKEKWISNTNQDINKMQNEIEEFRAFKKGKIWKYMNKYRKVKDYVNKTINISKN